MAFGALAMVLRGRAAKLPFIRQIEAAEACEIKKLAFAHIPRW